MFTKFNELQTVRQVHLWMRQKRLPLPCVGHGAEGRHITWKLPVYNTLHHMLTNPIYAGAYAFGRTGSRTTIEAGRKRIVRGFRKDRATWEVLIPDHHEGYIRWTDFERNQRLISDNANGKSFMSRGSIRRGEALLAGLLRCGHCGRKLHVAYSGADGNTGRYHCRGGHLNHGGDRCISFGGMRIDRAIGMEVIRRLQPLGIQAALEQWMNNVPKMPRSAGRLSWPSSRRASKRFVHIGSTTWSTQRTALLLRISSNAGMRGCSRCARSSRSETCWPQARSRRSPMRNVVDCLRWVLMSSRRGVVRPPRRRHASGSSAR